MRANVRDKIDELLNRASEPELLVVYKFILYLLRIG